VSHILFVGTDPALGRLHEHVAAALGHACDVAQDGTEGLERLAARPYDVIIAHAHIRPIDGLSWLRRVRSTLAPDTPCVLEGSSAAADEAARAGISLVLPLPVDEAALRSALSRALLRPRGPARTEFHIGCAEDLRADAATIAWGARLQTADALLERMEEYGLGRAVARGRRLAGSAAAVARALGLAREEIEDIQIGSMLHDVGLLLGAPGPGRRATLPQPAAAWERQQSHPTDGAGLLRTIPALSGAASLVENHHERHDGLGYPHGRIGAEIPTGARVFAVVEALDDLLQGLDGLPRIGIEEALEAVESGAGTRFDPDATAALGRALPELLRARLRQARGA
jgi:response regulator RpfG family c-di-GMP phosphodiesterase